MEAQFWIDSWDIGGYKTSFHRRDIHPYLHKHFPPATLRGKRVLVPLCGKCQTRRAMSAKTRLEKSPESRTKSPLFRDLVEQKWERIQRIQAAKK